MTALLALATLAACRPSQQTSRSANRQSRTASQSGPANQSLDSLLLVQQKLLELIDTMADVMSHDRERIRNLELEIGRMRQQLGLDPRRSSAPAGVPLPPSGAVVPGQQLPRQGSFVSAGDTPNALTQSLTGMPPAPQEYNQALQLFNQGRYTDALKMFDGLRRADLTSPYISNYEYWRGESLFALKRWDEAMESFLTVVGDYPRSLKADDAQFKIGETYERLGSSVRAKMAYEKLLAEFPATEYRTRAEARLRTYR